MLAVRARNVTATRWLAQIAGDPGQALRNITTRRTEAFFEIAVMMQDMLRDAAIERALEVLESQPRAGCRFAQAWVRKEVLALLREQQ